MRSSGRDAADTFGDASASRSEGVNNSGGVSARGVGRFEHPLGEGRGFGPHLASLAPASPLELTSGGGQPICPSSASLGGHP